MSTQKVVGFEVWDYVPEPSQCNQCIHFQGFGKCPAFPEGIPVEIVTNELRHTVTLKGQRGKYTREV